MKTLLALLLLIPSLLISEVPLKEPGTKYSDTRKQNTADEASRSGQVTLKQSGTKYSDTRKQSENNQRASDGQIMNKVPGQKYSDTRAGTPNDNEYFLANIKEVQSKDFKEKMKKKFKIKANLDEAIINPIDGSIITTKSLDKMVKDQNIEIGDMMNKWSKDEVREMILSHTKKSYEFICDNKSLSEVKDIMNTIESDELINVNLFVLNYLFKDHGLTISYSQHPKLCW